MAAPLQIAGSDGLGRADQLLERKRDLASNKNTQADDRQHQQDCQDRQWHARVGPGAGHIVSRKCSRDQADRAAANPQWRIGELIVALIDSYDIKDALFLGKLEIANRRHELLADIQLGKAGRRRGRACECTAILGLIERNDRRLRLSVEILEQRIEARRDEHAADHAIVKYYWSHTKQIA